MDPIAFDENYGTTEFLNPLSQQMVQNFSWSFNKYYRNNIASFRSRKVENIFVAENYLHGRRGVGFFLKLADGTVYHSCCGKGFDKNMIYNYVP